MIRVGVIGYGYWGPNLARNFSKNENCQLAAIADLDPEKLAKASRLYPGAQAIGSIEELLGREDIDAVAIATPLATHYPIAKQALESGKHVLVEKPLAASSRQCQELISIAESKGLALMVDHTFIYTGAVRKLKELAESGELGEVYYYDSVRVNLGLFQNDTNVLWDLATHDFSIMDFLVDKKPVRVTAVGSTPVRNHSWSMESLAYVNVEFEDGNLAHFHVNWLSPVKVRRTLIGGSRKMVIYDPLELDNEIKIYDKGVEFKDDQEQRYKALVQYRTGDMRAPKIDQSEALERVCGHFLECIESGQAAQTDGPAGLRVVQLLEAAQRSMDERRTVEVESAHSAVASGLT